MKSDMQSRRGFVKMLSYGSVASVLLKPWRGTLIADIVPSSNGQLTVKISDYPPLLDAFGSIRLSLSVLDENGVPLGALNPIIINRDIDSRFYALDSTCRHEGCIVLPYDNSEEAIVCPCHGSTYALNGDKLGGPASGPLLRYPIAFDGVDTLQVELPFLGYRVTGSMVTQGDVARFQLSFPTLFGSEYEVRFREKASEDWRVIPFALAVDGVPDQLSLIGLGETVVAYVERTTPTGFYAVSIKVVDLTAF